MLALFNKSFAQLPTAMTNANIAPINDPVNNSLASDFLQYYPQAITVKFGESGILSIDDCPKRRMIESREDVFCLFNGKLENKEEVLKNLKLTYKASDPHIITQMYRMSRREGVDIVHSSLSEFHGSFSFILYDSTCDYVAIGLDVDGSLPLFWGTDFADNVVVTNFLPMAVKNSVKSYASFPPGCIYTSSDGLRKFEHPLSKPEPVPWTDGNGKVRGVTFRIKEDMMPIARHIPQNS